MTLSRLSYSRWRRRRRQRQLDAELVARLLATADQILAYVREWEGMSPRERAGRLGEDVR